MAILVYVNSRIPSKEVVTSDLAKQVLTASVRIRPEQVSAPSLSEDDFDSRFQAGFDEGARFALEQVLGILSKRAEVENEDLDRVRGILNSNPEDAYWKEAAGRQLARWAAWSGASKDVRKMLDTTEWFDEFVSGRRSEQQ